jgi:hypothetical protein
MEQIRRNQNPNNNDTEGWTGYAPLSAPAAPGPNRGRVMVRPRPDTMMSKGN